MLTILAVFGVLLLGYAGGLFWAVRTNRRVPPAANLILVLINLILVAALVVWAVRR